MRPLRYGFSTIPVKAAMLVMFVVVFVVAPAAGMEAAMGPCKLEYSRIDVGTNLFNEAGKPFIFDTSRKELSHGQIEGCMPST